MAFWLAMALWVVSFAVSQVMADREAKKNMEDAVPKGLGDFQFPTNSETRRVPWLIGTKRQKGPNLLWYGNLRALAIREKVKTSLFSSRRITTGHQYFLGMQLGLCQGPVILRKVWYGDTLVWSGRQEGVGTIPISPPWTRPGGEFGRLTGTPVDPVTGFMRFYPGTEEQSVDPYLAQYQNPCPAYRGMSYVVFDGYVGTDARLNPWSFEIQRIVNHLSLPVAETVTVAQGTNSPTGSLTGELAIRFTLASPQTLARVRLFGTPQFTDATWVGGVLISVMPVQLYSGSSPATGTLLWSRILGRTDVVEQPSFWEFDLGGTEVPAGTYCLRFRGTLPTATQSPGEVLRLSGSSWITEARRGQFAIYGENALVVDDYLDTNPMNAAVDVLVNGAGYAMADIDTVGFYNAGVVLEAEGNKMSLLLDSPMKMPAILREIEGQVNCKFYLDPVSGQWKVQMIRDDYDPGTLPVFDESSIVSVETFSRGTWEGTKNQLHLHFNNRHRDYADTVYTAQDFANRSIQGSRVGMTVQMAGVCNAVLAGKLAWRELHMMSFPLAMARITVDRRFWNLHVGQPVIFSHARHTDNPVTMRITSLNAGGPENGAIDVELVQDIFVPGATGLVPPSTGWQPPVTGLQPYTDQVIEEMPYAVSRRQNVALSGRLWTMARETGAGEEGYRIRANTNDAGSGIATPWAILQEPITPGAATLTVATAVAPSLFLSATDSDIGTNLAGLILVNGELMAIRSAVDNGGGLMTLTVYRGLCDTAQKAHAGGLLIWLLFLGWGGTDTALTGSPTVRLLPYQEDELLAEGLATPVVVAIGDRAARPYPPTNLRLNTHLFPTTVNIDSGITVAFNRRDWRIFNEVSQLAIDAATLDPTFPAANSTQYKAVLYDTTGAEVWSSDYNAGEASGTVPLVKILRHANGCPTTVRVGVRTRHSGTQESLQDLQHEAAVVSALSDDFFMGVLDTQQLGGRWTAPTTGDYGVTLDRALAADVEIRINEVPFTSIITAGSLAGTLAGVVAGDIIEVRHQDSSTSGEALMRIDAPGTTEDAFAILVFTNT